MDPRMYPIGSEAIPAGSIVTTPTTSDKIVLMRGGNAIKAITIANLFATPPDTGGTTPSQSTHDSIVLSPTILTVTGTIATDVSLVHLNHSSTLIAATIAAPAIGRILIISQIDSGTEGHTVTLTAGTYNGSNIIATFNAINETLVLLGISTTRFIVVENIGSVALTGS